MAAQMETEMKPYGNEHSWRIEALNASRHRPNMKTLTRRSIRRAYRHTRRAIDKIALRRCVEAC